jgi:hypothetical protein
LIIAAAHPTPFLTESAPNAQFCAHAPHSMQLSGQMTRALLSRTSKTPCGQTSTHRPQPVHFSKVNFSVDTPAMYISFI